MSEVRLQVAGLVLQLDGAPVRLTARYRPFFCRRRPDLRLAVIRRVCEAPARGPTDPKVFYEHGLSACSFERPGLYGDMDLRKGTGRLVITYDRTALDTALRVALTAALLPRDTFIVHALGVREGFLVPGASGAGKSTLGRRAGPSVLSDELVAVSPGRLHATPFWGDSKPPQRSGAAPHRLTCFLRRSGPFGVRPLARPDALAHLLATIVWFADSGEAAERLLRLAGRAACARPSFTLRFHRRRHPWHQIRDWIRGAA